MITGEGFLDAASFAGKVVGGIVERAELGEQAGAGRRRGRRRRRAARRRRGVQPSPRVVVSDRARTARTRRGPITTGLIRDEVSRYLRVAASVASLRADRTTGCATAGRARGRCSASSASAPWCCSCCGGCGVVFPPLVLAATIVFLLNPVVTRIEARRHPPRRRRRARLPRGPGRGHGDRTRDVAAGRWPGFAVPRRLSRHPSVGRGLRQREVARRARSTTGRSRSRTTTSCSTS